MFAPTKASAPLLTQLRTFPPATLASLAQSHTEIVVITSLLAGLCPAKRAWKKGTFSQNTAARRSPSTISHVVSRTTAATSTGRLKSTAASSRPNTSSRAPSAGKSWTRVACAQLGTTWRRQGSKQEMLSLVTREKRKRWELLE